MNRLLKRETGGGSNSILLLFCVISILGLLMNQLTVSMRVVPNVSDSETLSEIPIESRHETNHSEQEQSTVPPPPKCSQADLLTIRHQLPPDHCILNQKRPYLQRCSLTIATKCPKATWLEDYYQQLQTQQPPNSSEPSTFLGISVGCNKGFDAINTLRMGTSDASINKVDWNAAMQPKGSKLHNSVCQQNDPNDIFPIQNGVKVRPGEMHCIEPMPQTASRLKHAASTLGYTHKGLTVTQAAVSKDTGEMWFFTGGPNGTLAEGIENKGLATCQTLHGAQRQQQCEKVPVYSLREFVQTTVRKDLRQHPIHILSIDVEGFDGDVLLGASQEILDTVEYLEFEYNWMGSWKNQHLWDIVTMLDETAHMTCYWAGVDRLWRITNCWMQYYDLHTWSNVACVHRKLVPALAARMEETFQRTLAEGTNQQWTFEKQQPQNAVSPDHELLSTDPDQMAKPYYVR